MKTKSPLAGIDHTNTKHRPAQLQQQGGLLGGETLGLGIIQGEPFLINKFYVIIKKTFQNSRVPRTPPSLERTMTRLILLSTS